jgi:hypothetical protein
MKKRVLIVVIALGILLPINNIKAANYTLQVDDTTLSKNQNVVFDEQNVGPGFNEDYIITVRNISSKVMRTRLVDIQVINTSLLLDKTNLGIIKDNIIIKQGKYDSLEFNDAELFCTGTNKSDEIKVNINIPSDLNNSYQGLSFKLQFNFETYESSTNCDNKPLINDQSKLPKTGESRNIYNILYATIGTCSLAIIILFVLIKREKREEKHEKIVS